MNTTETINLLTKRIETLNEDIHWATTSAMNPQYKKDLIDSISADIEYYQNQINHLKDQ
jgi:hypothetical protein